MSFSRRKLKNISRFINQLINHQKLKIMLCSFCLSILLALVYSTLAINIVTTVIGLTSIISSIFLYLSEKSILKSNTALVPIRQTTPFKEHTPRNVALENGNYVEKNDGTYVQRDFNQNNLTNSSSSDCKNDSVTINNQRVEIGSDISRMFDEFRDILNDMMSQSSNVIEAISQFSKELVEELRKKPQVKKKECFNAKEYDNEKELVDGFIKVLLTQEYSPIASINLDHQFINRRILESLPTIEEEYEKSLNYKTYKIYLLKGKNNMWYYKIQRGDLSYLEKPKRQASYREENALKKAKSEIDKEITQIFHN